MNVIYTKKEKMYKFLNVAVIVLMIAFAAFVLINPAFAADDPTEKIKEILNKIVSVIELIFQAVGAILSVYAIGQLVLAFKNEDSDSKSRASTLLVVGVVLIALPFIIDAFGLIDEISVTID